MDDNDRGFQDIYEAYRPKILRYLARLVGEEEAEDLAQEVFIKAGQALPAFRGDSSLSTWLYRIATHSAYDRLRSPAFRRTRRGSPSGDGTREEGEEAECAVSTGKRAISVEQQLVQKEMSACILSYIQGLPESYQAVLVLSDLEQLSNPQIADILGITLGAVKIRLHRARARLREDFLNHCEYYWVSELGWKAL
jgi:RNA polymerase sigma-70 factor (ECF subfamily)